MVGGIIDISLPMRRNMPVWPDSAGFRLIPTMRLEGGEDHNVSKLECDLHVGTHVDAPWHCVASGITVDRLPLSTLLGPAMVAYLPQVAVVTADDLATLDLPSSTKRLLLRTNNSELWEAGITEFKKDFVALTLDGAEWVVSRGIALIGIDYLSIQRYEDSPPIHQVLLEADVVILEGLNLAKVEPGEYELICLPLNLEGAEGSPVRAVLRDMASQSGNPSASRGSR